MKDCDDLWTLAESARKAALRASLRDKLLWGDQVVNGICGLIKVFCTVAAIAIALERLGLPVEINRELAFLIALPLMVFNPKAFYWRNLFTARADAAFDEALRNQRP